LRGSHDANRPETVAPRLLARSSYAETAYPQHDDRYAPAAYGAHDPQPRAAAEQNYRPSYPQASLAHEQAEPHAAAYAEEPYDPAYAYDDPPYADEQAPPRRGRGGLMAVAALLGLAAFGAAGAFAYRAYSSAQSGQPPVIKASVTPNKVTPATPNRETPRSSERGQTERMVPREEQPIELREARVNPRVPAAAAMVGMTGQAPGAMVPPTSANAANGPNEPKKVKTIAIRPDGSVAPRSRAAATRSPALALASEESTQANAAPIRTASIPPIAAGTHVVQVSSQKSESDAQASFRALQAKYPTVLGGRNPLIRRVDLGERGTFYRVQVGPFASADQANDLCGSLKAAGGQCIVHRN
jgi:hypothetical protein